MYGPSAQYQQSAQTVRRAQRVRQFNNPLSPTAAPGTTGQSTADMPAPMAPKPQAAPAAQTPRTASAGVPVVTPAPAPAAAPAAPAPASTVGAPATATSSVPQLPTMAPGLGGKLKGAKYWQRQMLNLQGRNATSLNPNLMAALQQLTVQANQPMSEQLQASYLNPRLQALGDQERQALGGAVTDAESRGLGDSSFAAAREGALQAGYGGQRANLVSGLYNLQDQRQQDARTQLLQALQGLVTGNSTAAQNGANQLRQLQLEQQAMNPGFDLGGLFSGLLGSAGGIMGGLGNLGWKPFG